MSDVLNGRYMLHPESENEWVKKQGVLTIGSEENLDPFEIEVIGVQSMTFSYFARATIGPGESHYSNYRAMGVFYTIPNGDGEIHTAPLKLIRKI